MLLLQVESDIRILVMKAALVDLLLDGMIEQMQQRIGAWHARVGGEV